MKDMVMSLGFFGMGTLVDSMRLLSANRRAAWAALGVVVLLLVMTLWQFMQFWRESSELSESTAAVKTLSDNRSTIRLEIDRIPTMHLFGQPDQPAANLPGTHLELQLTGIIEAVPEKFSKVTISEAGGPARVYGIGDTLSASGVRVQAIHRDSVVLDNGGRLEKLTLQRSSLQWKSKPASLPEE